MRMESEKPETTYGQCRCCMAQGHHRDITRAYYYSSIQEIYFEIFVDCFNLFLSTSSTLFTLICTKCIHQLREAASFRRMVVATEKKLLSTLNTTECTDNKGTVFVNVGPQIADDYECKTGVQVKPELSDNDDQYLDDDQDSDTSICIQSEVELEREAELLSRFPPNSIPRLPSRRNMNDVCPGFVKHLDSLRDKTILPSMIESIIKKHEQNEKDRRKKLYLTEKLAHIANMTTIIKYSNVAPFRAKSRSGFPCFYCRAVFEDLRALRTHQHKHDKSDIRTILKRYEADYLVVYADVTDLKCSICEQSVPNLNELKTHLTHAHKKKLFTEYSDRVIPFRSDNNRFVCQACGFSFETFGTIERHMNMHYRNYICDECDTGFVTKRRLKVHIYTCHVDGCFPCDLCKKVFSTPQKHKTHIDAVHKMIKKNKCPKCPQRFADYFTRAKHMAEVHGLAPLEYKCNVCDKSFNRRYGLTCHLKRSHLEDRDVSCELCSYKCYTKTELKKHMVRHNGARTFECTVCKKAYARKNTLKEHMRIHANDRRYVCPVCGQAFVQNCSLKGHMKSHHPEYLDG